MKTPIRISHSEMTAKEVLDQYLGNFKKLDNVRPDWLEGLELDRFYPTLGIAIEFQGDQHFRTVPGMHKGPDDFQRQVRLDTKKQQIIEKQGIRLYPINLLDLDRFRAKNLVRRIVEDGKKYTREKGYREEYLKLQKINWSQEPEERLMRRTDRLAKIRKTYYRPEKKTWWRRLLGS